MGASGNPLLRLHHIRDEIAALRSATDGISYETFHASYVLRRTTEHAILIVSKAVRTLPADLLERHPGPRWNDIKGIGNILRHDYFAVDARVLWNILAEHLPALARSSTR
ncbi:DUF86 domain-containing protein [Methylobacterium organophilum]|uniref:HepT-like ribonuclease domain-containing protein n=1 Tax=Methylobacterium organophilum TaxID=410 RepID=UPI001F12B47D|nr:HepT-like ribonuclease domain-containing protein [Methylobacterium organophilum]UMY15984.1 DUF86 domain-containing protein [Methylobacterium organophilum]